MVCARLLRCRAEVEGGELEKMVGKSGVERWRDMGMPLRSAAGWLGEDARLLLVRVRVPRRGR